MCHSKWRANQSAHEQLGCGVIRRNDTHGFKLVSIFLKSKLGDSQYNVTTTVIITVTATATAAIVTATATIVTTTPIAFAITIIMKSFCEYKTNFWHSPLICQRWMNVQLVYELKV